MIFLKLFLTGIILFIVGVIVAKASEDEIKWLSLLGAVWAVIGGILTVVGAIGFIWFIF